MKIVAKKDRKLLLINTGNTQNENKAETIELTVPEEYEDYNKKIVFVTDDGIVWDIIQDNTYKLTKAITKYKQVDFYIWLTKDDVDFRTETRPLRFYYNKDASGEITPEEISGVNTVVNILEEEITKVDSLETELRDLITDIQNKLDNGEFDGKDGKDGRDGQDGRDGVDGKDGQDGYTPQKGIDYFTEQDIEEIEGDILNEVYTKSETDTLLEGKADVEDIPDVSSFITKDVNNLTNYTLKTNTGSLIDLEINDTTYVVTLKLKTQDGTVISTDTIDLPLESVVVSGRYDNTTKKVILTLENGSEVDFSVADLVAGLQSEITSTNKLPSDLVDDTNSGNKFVTTSEKQTWNDKLDESDLTDYVKNTDYASSSKGGVLKTNTFYSTATQSDGNIRADVVAYSSYLSKSEYSFIGKGTLENVIAGKQLINQTQLDESQATQDEEIEKLQEENARFKATLPTTTGEGQDITLDKTAEFEFIKPPLPMGNSEQVQYSGENLFNKNTNVRGNYNCSYTFNNGIYTIINTDTSNNFSFTLNLNLSAGSYTLNSNSYLSVTTQIVNQSNVSITNLSTNYNCVQFTTQEDIYGIRFNWVATSQPVTLDLNSLQIVSGTYTSSTMPAYEPYVGGTASPNPDYPQEITNVTGDVEVKVQNKNLFDKDNVINAYLNADGTTTSNNTFRVSDYINIKGLDNITISGNYGGSEFCCFYDKNKEFISYFGMGSLTTRVASVPTNAEYVRVTVRQDVINKYQLEQGSTATPYTPHKQQVLPLTLGNIELCKIGDYQDYFYKESNKWYLHKEIAKKILDGSENWTKSGAFTNSYFLYIPDSMNIQTTDINIYVYCNNYRRTYYSNILNYDYSCILSNNKNVMIHDNSIDNVEDFKTWLSTHNTIVYYVLATPTDTEITDTTLISQLEAINNALSYEEQTNISSNTIALFNVEAYQSTKLVLEEMATAIVALGGV